MKKRKKHQITKPSLNNTHITTIEQAKSYYSEMGCSHYGMARDEEFPHLYEEYKQLNINQELEREWDIERFDEYHTAILENTQDDLFSDIYNAMYNLFESLKTETNLIIMLDVAHFIREKVRFKDRVIIAETINGRTVREVRHGLIYMAFDMNHVSVAREFVELSLHFSTYIEGRTRGLERCQDSTILCNEIKLELGL